ncbi:hypothetical protein GCM10027456_76790 [Kineosporia babensis]|nr:SDR family NAD(P)-dependent oxidoreductase [Kineosporia babensis]
MSRLEGKVAFITGAARGQGRSHVLKLASEGADIIAVDLCADIETVGYPLSTPENLSALKAVLSEGEAELGTVDIVLANAGIAPIDFDADPEQTTSSIRRAQRHARTSARLVLPSPSRKSGLWWTDG